MPHAEQIPDADHLAWSPKQQPFCPELAAGTVRTEDKLRERITELTELLKDGERVTAPRKPSGKATEELRNWREMVAEALGR